MTPLAGTTHRLIGAVAGTALVLTVSGCTAAAPSATSSSGASQLSAPSVSEAAASVALTPTIAPAACPGCLGLLSAGTYSTTAFTPSITYTVPDDGWASREYTSGNFLLLPPGESLAGVHADTSEFVGVYRGVGAAAAGCDEVLEPGVGHSAEALVDWLASQRGLVVTAPQPASVGGLSGLVIDVSLAAGWTETCPFIPGVPLVPLIFGTGLTGGLGLVVEASYTTRLYLLDFDEDNIAVVVVNHAGRLSLDDYDAVVRTIQFDLGS